MLNLKSRVKEHIIEGIEYYSDKILKGDYSREFIFSERIFNKLPYNVKQKYYEYIEKKIENGLGLSYTEFNFAPDNLKLKYIEKYSYLSYVQFRCAPDNIKLKYIEKRIEVVNWLSDNEFNFATDNLKLKYIERKMDIGNGSLSDIEFNFAPDNLKLKYIEKRIERGRALSDKKKLWYNKYKINQQNYKP